MPFSWDFQRRFSAKIMKAHAMKLFFLRLFVLSLFIFPSFVSAQTAREYAQSITQTDISEMIHVLAADSLAGRDTGSPGIKKARNYILQRFKAYGLAPVVLTSGRESYLQPFSIHTGTSVVNEGYLEHQGVRYNHLKETLFYQGPNMEEPLSAELIFVGTGEEESYKSVDVKGKMVLLIGNSYSIFEKTELAQQKGAIGCVVVPNKTSSGFRSFMTRMGMALSFSRPGLRKESNSIVCIAVAPETAAKLLGVSLKKFKKISNSKSIRNPGIKSTKIEFLFQKKETTIQAENILGYIEGSEFPEEVLIITAHYDHVGQKGEIIFNGADDNASGTTALMEIAEAFALAQRDGHHPKRSILFIALAAEEKGLLGSQYYADYDPVFPLENTVINLNMDMVGHLDNDHDHPNFVSIVGSDWLSSELHQIHEYANKTYVGLELDYTYNSKNHPQRFYYRSDQYNFAKHNIPVIFYTSGDHEDYHQPSDTVEKIQMERIQKVSQLVFHTAWEVANRDKRIVVDGKVSR